MSVNDICTFLHHPAQRWDFQSDMDHRRGYVFDTLSTAHGACTLPGEDVAEQCFRALEEAEAAVAAGDVAALVEAVLPIRHAVIPVDTPPALRAAIVAMAAVADEALANPAPTCGEEVKAWSTRSRDARQRVVRMSLEMRMVVSIDD
jgi:hypothetical protein